jgi:uncharacterized protein YcfL
MGPRPKDPQDLARALHSRENETMRTVGNLTSVKKNQKKTGFQKIHTVAVVVATLYIHTMRTTLPLRRQRRGMACWLLLVFLFVQQVDQCHGFATYLLGNTGCMTELSTDEVIMNHNVIAAIDSDQPEIQLRLVDDTTRTILPFEQQQQQDADHSYHKYYLPNNGIYQLQLQYDNSKVSDVQFVVDVIHHETGKGHFVQGQCDDQSRVTGRGNDLVELELTLSNEEDLEEDEDDTKTCAILVAGWATGHEAVRLTTLLKLCRRPPPTKKQQQQQPHHFEEKVPAKEKEPVLPLQTPKNPQGDKASRLEQYAHVPRHTKQKKTRNSDRDHRRDGHHPRHDQNHQQDQQQKSATLLSKKQHHPRVSVQKEKEEKEKEKGSVWDKIAAHAQRDLLHPPNDLKKQKQPLLLNDKNYAPIQLDTTWFLYGLGILVLGTLLVIQACRFATGASAGEYSSINGGKVRRL